MRSRKVIRRVRRTKKGKSAPTSKLSTPGIQDAVMAAIASANIQSPLPGEALDIGSRKGELIGAIRTRFGLRTTACDYTDTLMKDSTQRVDIVDLNAGKLPYLDNALRDTGFVDFHPSVDHYQRRSWVPFVLLFLPMKIAVLFFWQRERNKFRTITPENRDLVAAINSRDLLLGRTLIVCARKSM